MEYTNRARQAEQNYISCKTALRQARSHAANLKHQKVAGLAEAEAVAVEADKDYHKAIKCVTETSTKRYQATYQLDCATKADAQQRKQEAYIAAYYDTHIGADGVYLGVRLEKSHGTVFMEINGRNALGEGSISVDVEDLKKLIAELNTMVEKLS